jgi:hypothetical protein
MTATGRNCRDISRPLKAATVRAMMKIAVAIVALAACKSKDKTEPAPAATGSSGSSGSAAAGEPPPKAAATTGVTIKHQVPEFSGAYDHAFAQVSDADHQITIAFVRDCPSLSCDPGPWEAEQVAHVCHKAFIATAKVPSLEAGKFTLDVSFAGPADNVATATLEGVRIELSAIDGDAVTGTIAQTTTESSASGAFVAKVCPRT